MCGHLVLSGNLRCLSMQLNHQLINNQVVNDEFD